jgi:hypothetical protein
VRKNWQPGDAVADSVVGSLQRCLAQVLLVRRFQNVVRDIARTGHDEVAVIHSLSDDDRHKAIRVGDLLGISRLQRGEG